jgi:putative ATP-dependent endonuclease of the OLD family
MYICHINEIDNYRNLSGVCFAFNKSVNFLLGQNNVGKTNLLELLVGLVREGKFREEDYCDPKRPLRVSFSVQYSDDEIGLFGDVFDEKFENRLTILAHQETPDLRVEYEHFYSHSRISFRVIKSINLIYYSSLRMPEKELSFASSIGAGRVLKYLMKRSMEQKSERSRGIYNKKVINGVISGINRSLISINGLKNDDIKAYADFDDVETVSRLLDIGDSSGRRISELGDGYRYSLNIFLYILEIIVHLKQISTDDDFDKFIVGGTAGKRYFPILLILDEPEIHQHPQRQRALIKSIVEIIENKNAKFLDVLGDLFGIDGFVGQTFISTHSPNILIGGYKNIVRMHCVSKLLHVNCGMDFMLDIDCEKHFVRNFMGFREALFASSVVLVEGDSEYGAFPVFAQKLGINIDEQNISILRLDGAESVLKYIRILRKFSIPVTAILDRDKKSTYKGNNDIFFTDRANFEFEMMAHISFESYVLFLQQRNEHRRLIKKIKEKHIEINGRDFAEDPKRCLSEIVIPEEAKMTILSSEIPKSKRKRTQ